jgi:hypothetical protein
MDERAHPKCSWIQAGRSGTFGVVPSVTHKLALPVAACPVESSSEHHSQPSGQAAWSSPRRLAASSSSTKSACQKTPHDFGDDERGVILR